MSARATLIIASLAGALAVIIGAFGAHGLPAWLSRQGLDAAVIARRIETLEIGVRYQMYHALALLVLGLWQRQAGVTSAGLASWLWLAGMLLFSGCLYAYSLTGHRLFAMLAPLGGTSFIAGWIVLALVLGRLK